MKKTPRLPASARELLHLAPKDRREFRASLGLLVLRGPRVWQVVKDRKVSPGPLL